MSIRTLTPKEVDLGAIPHRLDEEKSASEDVGLDEEKSASEDVGLKGGGL